VTTQKRDLGLDVLKGIGCALMVVAHSKLKMYDYEDFIFWGNLAPALFFSVAGVTASFQAGKSLREMLLLYGFIFLLGFSYSGFLEPEFLNNFQFEIIQTIALGVLIIYLIERYLHPQPWIYGVLGVLAFGLDKFIYPLGFEALEGILIAPGLFPLIPWLSMFFLGVFAYRSKNIYNLILFFILLGLYYFLFGFVIPDVNESKWQFLPEFFIASSACLFLAFFLVRALPVLREPKLNALTIFWGANSLLFLYIHYAFIKFFRLFELQRDVEMIWNHPWLFWILVLAATTFAMLVITFLARWFEYPFRYLWMWGLVLVLIFIAPFLIPKESYVTYFELMLGIAFATFYPRLGKILKQEPS
jgi:fucose 4-O-acetylase-like acetyltransferase